MGNKSSSSPSSSEDEQHDSATAPPTIPPTLPSSVLTENPWRKTLGWDQSVRKALLSEIQSLQPDMYTNLDVTSFNLLFVGQIAAGKSSLINSINTVFKGRISATNAQAGKIATSFTKEFYIYEISPTLRIYDTMGIDPEASEMDVRNLIKAVEGHVPHRHTLPAGTEFHHDSPGYIARPTFSERAHCVAMVVNAQNVSQMKLATRKKLQSLASGIFARKIPLFIILTHLDAFCKEVHDDITNIYHSTAVEDLINKISTMVHGVPENQIFPVINYAKQVGLDDNMDILLLYALRQMLYDSQDHLEKLARDYAPSIAATES